MKKLLPLSMTLLMGSLTLAGCTASDMKTMMTNGEAIPNSHVQRKAINPSRVKLYYSNVNKPTKFVLLGRVTANNDNMLGIPHAESVVAEELKKQAASIGANAVINITTGLERTSGDAILIK